MAPRPARVLVVDEEPLCRWALRESLTAAGFETVEADGTLPLPRAEGIDVLVLDTMLPRAGALLVLERVLALSPGCRVLLLTSIDEVGVARLPTTPRSWVALQKPFDVDEIVAMVRRLAARRPRSRHAA